MTFCFLNKIASIRDDGPIWSANSRAIALVLLAGFGVGLVSAQEVGGQGEIHGRVVAAHSGEAVPAGWVVASPLKPIVPQGMGGAEWRQLGARIQSDGSFAIYRVPAGGYLLDVRAPGYLDTVASGQGASERVVRVEPGASAGEASKPVTLRLQRTGAIEGAVLDEDGLPLVKCNVTAVALSRDGRRALRHQPGHTASTDDRGRYRIPSLPAGNYYVSARREGVEFYHSFHDHGSPAEQMQPPGIRLRRAYHPGSPSASEALTISLQPGEERYGVDILYPPVQGFPIAGVLRNPDGSPSGNTHLTVMTMNHGHPMGMEVYHARTDERGLFQTEALPAGDYQISATVGPRHWGGGSPASGATLFADDVVSVSGGPRTGIVVELHSAMRVRGRVSGAIPRQSGGSAVGTRGDERGRNEQGIRAVGPVMVGLTPDEASSGGG